MNEIPREQEAPWFRQFWPWFLIALPASVVVAGLSTVYIANRHADDLVARDYYKEGLAINRRLEKVQRATELALGAKLAFSQGMVTARVSGPVQASALRLALSHPLEADKDFTVPLSRVSEGVYRGELERVVGSRWHWALEPLGKSAQGWRLDGVVGRTGSDDAGGR